MDVDKLQEWHHRDAPCINGNLKDKSTRWTECIPVLVLVLVLMADEVNDVRELAEPWFVVRESIGDGESRQNVDESQIRAWRCFAHLGEAIRSDEMPMLKMNVSDDINYYIVVAFVTVSIMDRA
jgi:hypothetical protein